MWPFASPATQEDDNRRNTRSQPGNLVPPLQRHRGLGLGRGRSRSPSPAAATPGQFTYPAANDETTMASAEQLQAIKDQLREEMRSELLQPVLSVARDPDVIRKKPEIPAFDKQHVDIWIRRMENAYIRAGISSTREKFAFLETKFAVDVDPVINEYLYGEPTEAKWSDFLAYLQKEYGMTRQQKASTFVDGFKRDGRRPSQYAAALNDRTKTVTLDDVKKEMLMRELPVEVRRMLQERIEDSTFTEAAELADSYFDREGKPRHSSATLNAVYQPPEVTNDESDDINAINNRFRPQRNQNSRDSSFRSGGQQPKSRNNNNAGQGNTAKSPSSNNDLCYYHNKFGDKARKCEEACPRFDATRFPGNGKAGHK